MQLGTIWHTAYRNRQATRAFLFARAASNEKNFYFKYFFVMQKTEEKRNMRAWLEDGSKMALRGLKDGPSGNADSFGQQLANWSLCFPFRSLELQGLLLGWRAETQAVKVIGNSREQLWCPATFVTLICAHSCDFDFLPQLQRLQFLFRQFLKSDVRFILDP